MMAALERLSGQLRAGGTVRVPEWAGFGSVVRDTA